MSYSVVNLPYITYSEKPTGCLRWFINENGEKVLQQQFECQEVGKSCEYKWKDVPVVEGESK